MDTLARRLRLVIGPELGVNIVDLGLVCRAEGVDGVAGALMMSLRCSSTPEGAPTIAGPRDAVRVGAEA